MNLAQHIPPDFSGVISIKQDGVALLESAYGYADIANGRSNRLDTHFVTSSAGSSILV